MYGFINGYVQDLATLEERNPELRAGELAARLKRLQAHQRTIEQRAKELGVSATSVSVRHLSDNAPPNQVATASSRTKVGAGSDASAAGIAARRGLAVGDTAITEAGDTLTVHSYEIPIPSPYRDEEAKAGYEYSVIDVEVCSNAESEERMNTISRDDFALQMPDNTRRQSIAAGRERTLPSHSVLLPGDPLRGLVFFKTPEDERPIAIIYTGWNRKKAKWII